MLNEYLPNELFSEEMVKRDWLLTNVEKDMGWLGGDLIVPFVGAGASSVEFNQMPGSSDISEDAFVRGKLTGPGVEVCGAMLFNGKDLYEHPGSGISEKTFLKILPDRVEAFMGYVKEVVSVAILNSDYFSKVTADTDLANGIVSVDHIDRFKLGQKVMLDDDDSAAAAYYVTAINVNAGSGTNNTGTVTLSASRNGGAANIAAYTLAQNSKFYHPGAQGASFTSVRMALLSAANGGSASHHGQTKTSYPILQAVNVDGSSITSANILDKILDAYTQVRRRGKGNASKIVLSYKHLGSILKLIELNKGPFKVTATATRASLYGWTEIDLNSVRGQLTVVGVQEMDDDVIFLLDMNNMTFRTNGMFQKRKAPDGKEYFESRGTSGFTYIVDIILTGDLEIRAPGHCGVIYGVSYA
jgi:hypothetical protein